MIVWLASYPRSGNTLVRMILAQIYGYDTYSVHNDFDLRQMGAVELVRQKPFRFDRLSEYRVSPKIYFVKTHLLPFTDDNGPAVYIVRDGRDALVSHARYRVDIEGASGFNTILDDLIGGKQLFGGWSRNVRSWMTRTPKPLLLRFEDLVENPFSQVKTVLDCLGLPAEPIGGHLPTFDELHARWPKFFRKGRTGSWKREMDPRMQQVFWTRHAEVMGEMGYR